MTITRDLIDQLQPGKEADALVARHVMGLTPCTGWAYSGMMRIQKCWMKTDCPHGTDECFWVENPIEYSQNDAAATQVIEKMAKTHDASLSWKHPEFPPFGSPLTKIQPCKITACFTRRSDRTGSCSESDSLPLSVCKAALMSLCP